MFYKIVLQKIKIWFQLKSVAIHKQTKRRMHIYEVIEISGNQLLMMTMNEGMLAKLKDEFQEIRFSRRYQIEKIEPGFMKQTPSYIQIINVQGDLNIAHLSEREQTHILHNKKVFDEIFDIKLRGL